jgi:hypothetical protein
LEKLFAGRDNILVSAQKSSSGGPSELAFDHPVSISLPQHCPGPEAPQWKVPVSEWPNELRLGV